MTKSLFMKKISTIFILICVSWSINAQFLKEFKHGMGYFGNNVINPGISYSLESPIWNSDSKGSFLAFLGDSELVVDANAGLYWDPFSHVGFLNTFELNYRQYLGKNFGFQFGGGPGYQINFTGENYIVDADFNVEKRALKLNSYFAPQISSAFLYSNKSRTKIYISKISVIILVPYNTSFVPVVNYEFIYQF